MLCAGGRGENEVHALKDTTSWLVRAHTHTCTTAPSNIRFLLSAGGRLGGFQILSWACCAPN